MKLPNGTGNVSKLPGKRRNPWRARKTKGWQIDATTGKAKQIFMTIGYFPSKREAIEALYEYNRNPYDIETDSITFTEVYEKWSEVHFQTIVPSAVRTWKSAYKYCEPLYNMRMKDIRAMHLEECIRHADVGATTKQRMKSLFNMMYKYALKSDIVDKNYAAMCDSIKRGKPQIERIPFSAKEIKDLIDNLNFPFVDMVLIGIYTGFRPQELSLLKVPDTNLENCTLKGGLKTDAGRNRIVPIHPAILPLIQNRMDHAKQINSEFLFNDEHGQQGTHMTYDKYRGRWKKVMDYLKMSHRPHDTRHTFITIAKEANMNEYILKLIVGHEISDVTERVYTHRTIEQLHKEINKLPNFFT